MATKRQRPEADGAMHADGQQDSSSLPVKVPKTTVDLLKTTNDEHTPPKAEESEQKPADALDPEEVLLSALEQEMAEYDAALHSSGADAKSKRGSAALPHVLEDDDYDESEDSD